MAKHRRSQRVSEESSEGLYGESLKEGSRSVRVSVTIDSGLLSFIDDYVERSERTNRSAVFDQALEMWVIAQQKLNDVTYYTTDRKKTKRENDEWSKVTKGSAKRIWS